MPKKTKIIFLTVFILIIILVGFYLYKKNKTPETPPTLIEKINPFGRGNPVVRPTTPGEEITDPKETEQEGENINIGTSRLHKLTDFSVSGATFFEESKIDMNNNPQIIPSLRYVEKETGHIYQMNLDLNTSGKISNSTILGVHETLFNINASSVIYRYASSDNKSITSFMASIDGKSSFLNVDILGISLSPDKNSFFSLIKNSKGVTGTIKSFNDTKTNQVFISSFSEWIPQWVTEKNIYLTTKASYLVEGSVFSLNTTNGTLSKLFGGINGLTTLSNKDGTYILFGSSLNTGPKLNIFDISNHKSKELGKFGLPEKCIWSNDNINIYCAIPNTIKGVSYPDSWYQGLVSFDDFFVKIDTKTGESSTLANSKNGTPVDAVNLFLDKNESKLFFINKKDYKLWSLDL